MSTPTLQEQLKNQGFVVIRQFLSNQEVDFYVNKLEERSGITKENFNAQGAGRGFDQKGRQASWNLPDGVSKSPDFWPLIYHERLISTVRDLLGPDIRFLQHTDLHVGFSAVAWHRDSVNRKFGKGPDWDESQAPYKMVRVGLYLQSHAESSFKLGFIKGSHRPATNITLGRRLSETQITWMGALSYLSPKAQLWAANAEWIATEPGDCIIFDPRTLHSGSYITGPKYSMFVAYGIENVHFYHHQNYYRHLRSELNYGDLAPELTQTLKAKGLYPDQFPVYADIKGAWTPAPVLKSLLAKRFKAKSKP
ncbi:MAG: phytanoyl-CoA dioxygenase family protein [Anaerolineae bacterium]|nr:phytanoyl-CoA dioxygenase family protein [Anaerolineae bacterium]